MGQGMEQRVEELRKEFGYSQEYVAARLFITQPAYSKKITGVAEITIRDANELAKMYDVTIDYIVNGGERK